MSNCEIVTVLFLCLRKYKKQLTLVAKQYNEDRVNILRLILHNLPSKEKKPVYIFSKDISTYGKTQRRWAWKQYAMKIPVLSIG